MKYYSLLHVRTFVAVFLLCWAPFFTVNIVNAVCIRYVASCDSDKFDDCQRSCRVDSSVMSCSSSSCCSSSIGDSNSSTRLERHVVVRLAWICQQRT